jgi:UDP-3-O-[3-hydroxymyristoyl] glucosamine N-acyltransferase
MKLAQLAERLGAELHGDGDIEVTSVRGIEDAGPDAVTFVANPKYAAMARTTQAAAILVTPDFPEIPTATLRLANPYLAFAHALGFFYQPPSYAPGIHSSAVIDESALIGADAHIGPYVVIGPGVKVGHSATILAHVVLYPGVEIGNHFFAHAHAVVREGCILGDHVTLENGAVVGSDGFGFAKDEQGRWQKIPQSGPVRIGHHVDIQANACVDRATVGATEIADGAKIDNLVQIGHGSKVGQNTLVCAQAGLAGSSVVGANAILAGQAGVAGHCELGDGVILTAQSGVSHDVAPGKMLSGSPAFENRTWLRAVTAFQRLPEILRRLHAVEKILNAGTVPPPSSLPVSPAPKEGLS